MGAPDLPLALAVTAGAVAAVNPCGFALLPAYLGLLVAGPDPSGGTAARSTQVLRAIKLSLAMTIGFVAVFGTFGVVVARLSLSIERYLPALTLVIGAALVGLGLWVLAGRHLPGIRILGGVGRAPGTGLGSQVLYGVAFATASLSCTIGPFLAVTTTAAGTGSALGVSLTFVMYAAGMGAVVTVLAVAIALARGSLVSRVRRATPVVERFSGVLLLLAGAYVAWYAWFEIRVQSGRLTGDPVVDAATRVQSEMSQFVAGLGPVLLALLAGAVLVAAAVLTVTTARQRGVRRP